MNRSHSQTHAQPLPKESYAFVLASLFNSMGSALIWPLTTIYVHNVLHRNYADAGIALFFQSLATIVGQVMGGALYARLGPRKLIIGSLVLTGCAQWSIIFARTWPSYVTAMTVNAFLVAITMPAVNGFVGQRWRAVSTRLFNVMYVSNNVGVAIGTTLAGILASISFSFTFLINGLSTLMFAGFLAVFMRRFSNDELADWQAGFGATRQQSPILLLTRYHLYAFVGIGSMLVNLATSAWNSGVAPYLNQAGQSPASYSLLWTVNGIVILVGQPVTSFINRRLTQSLASRLTASAILYGCAYALILATHATYALLMVGMVVATLGEMLIAPTIPALVTTTAREHAAFYLGVAGGIGSGGRLIGPILFGTLFDHAGLPPILWVAMGACAMAVMVFIVQQRLGQAAPHASYETTDEMGRL
ncbi:putative MFS-type transporter YttB [Alicyclobacillus hesperidum subsp. aegles]|uniref:MFS transporter n=1 Tax=Alicyclobacillus hesperidum TaxID=89784 RepID=UPI000719234E|nr:MFS transporter [Alicyclobacillus hesperidum]KRW92295.1 MFS transporter [Alicyclobacillus tengchongensis]GLG02053.1 putative MFS-type transporter YttB [Alicyclobacillus hesperidum subsp. aegles]